MVLAQVHEYLGAGVKNRPGTLHQCGNRVKTKCQEVLGLNTMFLVVTGENW